MHLPIVYTNGIVHQQKYYYKIGAESLNSTCLQSFVHVCIQVIELQELACCIVMYGPKLFFENGDIYTNFTLCLFSACHQTLSPH